MLNTFLSYLALYGLQSNIITNNGAGVLLFQREKSYRSFRYVSALILMVGIVLCSAISYVLYNYVYSKFDLYFISVSVSVFIVCVYHLLTSNIWKKVSSFKVYLYENSFSYALDVAFTLSVIFRLNMALPLVEFIMSVVAMIVVIPFMNLFLGLYMGVINRFYVEKSFRNVSARLFLFAIVSIIVYYASLLVI